MAKPSAFKRQEATTTHCVDRNALVCWTMVAMVYFLLAAYLAWFSVDKNLSEAAIWFSLGVCFFCIGLIPMPVSDLNGEDSHANREIAPDGKD